MKNITISIDDDLYRQAHMKATEQSTSISAWFRNFSPLANAGYRPQPITPKEFVLMHLAGRSAP
jgi:hypothetical protein